MSVQLALTSNHSAFKSEFSEHIHAIVNNTSKSVQEITVPGSSRKGWAILTDDLDLGDLNIEVRSMGCSAGVFEPYTNELYIVPQEWLNPKELKSSSCLVVPVEDERANKAFESYFDRAENKTYFYMGGIEMFREELDEDE